VGGDPARQVEASITDEARRVLDSGRAWDLEERSLAQIVDAYVVMLYDLEQDPEFSASPDGPLWREEVVAFEEGLRIEVSKQAGAPDDQPPGAVGGLGDLRLTFFGVVDALPWDKTRSLQELRNRR